MKNTKDLKYYGSLPYNIILETWDDGKGPYYVARVAELPHCLIHGDTSEEAIREIEIVKREWIESNLKRGNKIPEPAAKKYSGQISLRIPPSLHRLLINASTVQDVSLNQYMTMALANFVGIQFTEPKDRKYTAGNATGRRNSKKAPM
nr:putative HicB family protein [uncultured bacterium]